MRTPGMACLHIDWTARPSCLSRAPTSSGCVLQPLGLAKMQHLDEGEMWPTSYASNKIDKKVETRIIELIKQATGHL